MPTIDATVGGATTNSYETEAEANVYFDSRLPLPTPWVASGALNATALIMATRLLDSMAVARKTLKKCDDGSRHYYTSRTWTGQPATTTQRLAWPRVGMFDANGNEIPSNVIPQALKDAESELAGQLLMSDTTLDNAATAQGISSVRAGSVSVTFKDTIDPHVIPDAVLNLMPPSWFTDEIIEPAYPALFDVISS